MTSTKSILLLPSEIIDIICIYLSGSDYCTCLCVNTTWYNTFIHRLYNNLTIHGEQHLEQICRNLLQHASIYLGNSVRTVNLRLESISNRHLSQLGAWCIHVESLSLRWSIWHEDEFQQQQQQQQDDNNNNNDNELAKRKEQFPSIMASFIGPFMNLTKLSLDVSFGKQEITLPDFIPFLPRLISLTMANGTHLSLEYIEYIHKMCPSLQHLSLQGTFIGRIPSIIPAAGTTNDMNDSILDRSDIKPATSLRTIELEFVIGGHDYYLDWFSYFGIKYPNLVSFEFRQYGLPVSPSTSAVIGPQRQISSFLYDHVFTHLAIGCPNLTGVHLYNIHIHSGFFEKLNQTLQHITLHLPVFPTTSYLSNLFNHTGLRQHLTSLDISIPVKKDNNTNNNNNNRLLSDQLVAILGQLCSLKSLTLRGGNEVTCIHLDTFLQHFTHLTHLTLVGLKLGLQLEQYPSSINNDTLSESTIHPMENQQNQLDHYYPLESLTLRSVSMMDPWYLFPWIDTYVKLSYLTLTHSCRSMSTLTNRIAPCTIWLPNTRLRKCVTNERRLQNKPIILYMLQKTNDLRFGTADYSPRFTDLDNNTSEYFHGDKHSWYILKYLDPEMASIPLVPLKTDWNFEWVVTYHSIKQACPWYANFCDAAEDVYTKQNLDKNKVDDIDGVQYMKIVCRSIDYLKINGSQLSFAG